MCKGETYGKSFGVAASSGRGGGRLMIMEGVLAAMVVGMGCFMEVLRSA
jgi:hypothetical protein